MGEAEKSLKDDSRFLAGEVPFHQLPMTAGTGVRVGRTKVVFGPWDSPDPDSISYIQSYDHAKLVAWVFA